MKFRGRVWGRSALPAGLALLLAGPAWGQPEPQRDSVPIPAATVPSPSPAAATPAPIPAATAPKADPLSPSTLMSGPSLYETGRIATAPVAASANMIENEPMPNGDKEKSISPVASTIDVAALRAPAGFIDPRVLDREIAERFTDVANCRIEVARSKQVKPPQIVADRLLLRWIIERDGTTAATDVVATAPVDLGVMDCAKRVMSQWRFTPPRNGSKAVERAFVFH